MSPEDAVDDAARLEKLFQHNQRGSEPFVHLQVPLAAVLAALDGLSRDDLLRVRTHVEQRLAG